LSEEELRDLFRAVAILIQRPQTPDPMAAGTMGNIKAFCGGEPRGDDITTMRVVIFNGRENREGIRTS